MYLLLGILSFIVLEITSIKLKTLIITPLTMKRNFFKLLLTPSLVNIYCQLNDNVDDQSFDRTSILAHEAAKKYSWINYLKKEKKTI